MRWRDVSPDTVWRLHVATGLRLGVAVVRAFNAGLQVHLIATRTGDGARSITVLGVAADGITRTYAEVELVDTDDATQAHEQLRLDDVLQGARATLARADAALDAVRDGEPVPTRRDTRGMS